jgi:hypothetical protein
VRLAQPGNTFKLPHHIKSLVAERGVPATLTQTAGEPVGDLPTKVEWEKKGVGGTDGRRRESLRVVLSP